MESVKVALRIRPLVQSEIENGCRSCVERLPGEPQVSVGKNNQTFTFNFVFDENEGQSKVYNHAVKDLIDNLFKGYNVTILAYGQTGSGKTFTMGTNYSGEGELGVIPRVVYEIFEKIDYKADYNFGVSVSFLELYNESLFDLLTDKPREQSIVDMRETSNGICIPGLTEIPVSTADSALAILKEGSSGRVVGATAMNAASSRSHAVFTISIKIMSKHNPKEIMASKFHLVDLAGSERSKKTRATGDRFKEGININKGLMMLGNVISQLGEGGHSFINYRDSKLTRLLQDSLGGNSVTLMIACISPADYNQDETLSTLRYADRARKIKNKPIVNQDPASAELSRLRKENEELRLKIIGSGVTAFADCPPEHKQLERDLSEASEKINQLSNALYTALAQNATMHERTIIADKLEESLKVKLKAIDVVLEQSVDLNNDVVKEMKDKINELRDEQSKAEQEKISFDRQPQRMVGNEDNFGPTSPTRHQHILSQAKINEEINTITQSLVWKEQLIAKLCESAGHLGEIEGQDSVEQLKQQIAELQKEKDELLQQMKETTSVSIPTSAQMKVSEQRRKRLQELEQKVTSLSKKVTEQERIIKMKEQSEEKIKNLRHEIMATKQHKVRLIQQMKSENDKFRSWKQEKDREVCLLKNQNMKKQNQLKKMEQIHNMQQSVLKRKLEAAAAANKRIMAALERQKVAKIKRLQHSLTDRIKDKLSEELELIESEYQAQKSLDSLIQDRAALSKELSVIKNTLNNRALSQEEKAKLYKDMKEIDDDLAMRSAEISDLQQKLLDIHQDDKARGNWDILQTMSDAKFAVSHVISLVAERVKESINISQQLTEVKDLLSEQEQLSEERRQKLAEYSEFHEQDLQRLEKEYEDKVYVLLKRLQSSGDRGDFLSETEKIHLSELEKMEDLRKRVAELEEQLQSYQLNSKKPVKSFQEVFLDFVESNDTTMIVPKGRKKTSGRNATSAFEVADEESLKEFDETFEIDNDDANDPDWAKTPLNKRIQVLKPVNNASCVCRGNCSRKVCACKRNGSFCASDCSCSVETCKNKANEKQSRDSEEENISPKRLRLSNDSDNDQDIITYKSRRTFTLDTSDP